MSLQRAVGSMCELGRVNPETFPSRVRPSMRNRRLRRKRSQKSTSTPTPRPSCMVEAVIIGVSKIPSSEKAGFILAGKRLPDSVPQSLDEQPGLGFRV